MQVSGTRNAQRRIRFEFNNIASRSGRAVGQGETGQESIARSSRTLGAFPSCQHNQIFGMMERYPIATD
eukprot:gene31233-6383_t